MEYLIFSDTHGNSKGMIEVIERCLPHVDGVLFLGDGMADCMRAELAFPQLTFVAVAGNCDMSAAYCTSEWRERLINIEGKKILMMHGHTHGVKFGLEDASSHAKAMGADVLLFGHTHQPLERRENDVLCFNPGSASRYADGEPSFGRLVIRKGEILLSHGSVREE